MAQTPHTQLALTNTTTTCQPHRVPVHSVDASVVLLDEVLLYSKDSYCSYVLNGVHCHHASILQSLLVASNVPTEYHSLEGSTHNEDGYSPNYEKGHNPRVDEGNDKSDN